MTQQGNTQSPSLPTASQVLAYLQANPDFIAQNPELLKTLTPPKGETGSEKVLDFNQFALGNLQSEVKELQSRFDGLLTSARDNMSAQRQIHEAVLELMKAQDLESLLEVITTDLVRLFDVDVVRLAMESEVAEFYDPYAQAQHHAGVIFVPLGTVDRLIGMNDTACLLADAKEAGSEDVEVIFKDCEELVGSIAMLRLRLVDMQREVALIFAVREVGRFHSQQATDLLSFLAEIVEFRLDQCLARAEEM